MDTNKAYALARSLMVEHGVGSLDFGWHHYPDLPGTVGRTHVHRLSNGLAIYFKITLDFEWVKVLPEYKVREVILHEIAHAITPVVERSTNSHNSRWERACNELGIAPEEKFIWDKSQPACYEQHQTDRRNLYLAALDKA